MICDCCGFKKMHGVYTYVSRPLELAKIFVCRDCFANPHLWFNSRRLLPGTFAWKLPDKGKRKRFKAMNEWPQHLLTRWAE